MTATATASTLTLSEATTDILKNFASINSNFLAMPGSLLKTCTPGKNLMAKAKVAEAFEVSFGIWDMNKFLSILSTFDSPELVFEEKFVTIKESKTSRRVKFWFSEPSLLTVPKKDIQMPPTVINFKLKTNVLADILKSAAILQVGDLAIESDGDEGNIVLKVYDSKDNTSNDDSIVVGPNDTGATFKFLFKVENLKLLPGTYDVGIAEKGIAHFTNTAVDLQYFIALEPSSTYAA